MTVTTGGPLPGGGACEPYDVTVVGAGVVGSAIARELARLPLRIALVDASDDVGNGTSKANTAILHTGFDAVPGSLESRLVRDGQRLLASYAADSGIPVEPIGALLVAWNEEQLAALPGLADKAVRNGYRSARILPAEEVRAREPELGPGSSGRSTSRTSRSSAPGRPPSRTRRRPSAPASTCTSIAPSCRSLRGIHTY